MPMRNIGLLAVLAAVMLAAAWLVWGEDTPTNAPETPPSAQSLEYAPENAPAAPPATAIEEESPLTTPMNDLHRVTIETNLGTIVFQTYDADAPKAVENFLTLANKGYYNGVIFHRVISGFMIQGGDPTGTGRGGPGYTFEDELDPTSESAKRGYVRGTVAMANAGPNTNGSQFFIMHEDYALPHNYTIFGHVVSGQDVVDKIASVPTDGADKPLQPVTMTTVTTAALE